MGADLASSAVVYGIVVVSRNTRQCSHRGVISMRQRWPVWSNAVVGTAVCDVEYVFDSRVSQ